MFSYLIYSSVGYRFCTAFRTPSDASTDLTNYAIANCFVYGGFWDNPNKLRVKIEKNTIAARSSLNL